MKMKYLILINLLCLSTFGIVACTKQTQISTISSQENDADKIYDDVIKKSSSKFTSIKDLEAQANKNNAEALYQLATLYSTGNGISENQLKAFQLFKKSADLENVDAMEQLGLIFRDGTSAVKINDIESLKWFIKAADKGSMPANHNIGFAYYHGRGVKQDRKKAYEYFIKSAESGLLQSQMIVAAQLYRGDGIPKDLKESFKWSLKAAEQGDPEMQNYIGLCYENGYGIVDIDPIKAKIWFERAANSGSLDGQYNIAMKYYLESGTKDNLAKSIKYAEQAAQKNYKPAIELLINIYSDKSSLSYSPEKSQYWKTKL
jgi:uncharacterized protein